MHQPVKNFSPRQVTWGNGRYVGEDGIAKKKEKRKEKEKPQVGVLQRPSSLSEGLRFPQKLHLQRTPLAKGLSCWHPRQLFIMLKILHWRCLGRTVNPGQRTHFIFIANHIGLARRPLANDPSVVICKPYSTSSNVPNIMMSKQVELVIKYPAGTINAMCLETNIVPVDFKRQRAYYRRSCVRIPMFAGGVAI